MRWTDEYIRERIIASNQFVDAPVSLTFYSALALLVEMRNELQAKIVQLEHLVEVQRVTLDALGVEVEVEEATQ